MLAPRTTIIVNPHSQGGRLGKRWPELADTIGRAFPFDEAITKGPGDATKLAAEALKAGAERIVAIGGDGTVNEVVNGFFDAKTGTPIAPEASFGLIPFGTGGDFRRTFGLPLDTAEAAAVIAANHKKKIDVGKLRFVAGLGTSGAEAHRMFANIASFGVSGVVDRMVNASGKKFGKLSFVWNAARASWGYKNQRVQLTFDDDPKDRVEATINTVAVANGKFFGGAMKIAPDAEPDDGMFDVVVMGDLSFFDVVTKGRRVFKGAHIGMDEVSSRRAKIVDAEPIDPRAVVELDVDGEAPGRLPARFEILPAALWFVVPGGSG
ncbi:MAG: diacylglycerol kinase family lipid kinase [Deltaproteobacteria bacterium]|nr:diacylglycerol kinase family lipid kinase [Deltaproteobacteria bacterium]